MTLDARGKEWYDSNMDLSFISERRLVDMDKKMYEAPKGEVISFESDYVRATDFDSLEGFSGAGIVFPEGSPIVRNY